MADWLHCNRRTLRAGLLATTAVSTFVMTSGRAWAVCSSVGAPNDIACSGATPGLFVDNTSPGAIGVTVQSGATITNDGVTLRGDAVGANPPVAVTYTEAGPATITNLGAFNGAGIFAGTSGDSNVTVTTARGSQIYAVNNGFEVYAAFAGGIGGAYVNSNGSVVAGGSGVFAYNNFDGPVIITNTGAIGFDSATNTITPVGGHGVSAMTVGYAASQTDTIGGYISIQNAGAISALGNGVMAAATEGGQIAIVNQRAGSIDAAAEGVYAFSDVSGGPVAGVVSVINDGSILAQGHGVHVDSDSAAAGVAAASILVNNRGSITAFEGVFVSSGGTIGGDVGVLNSGLIRATGFVKAGDGVVARGDSGGSASVSNLAGGTILSEQSVGVSVDAFGANPTTGKGGLSAVYNAGTILAPNGGAIQATHGLSASGVTYGNLMGQSAVLDTLVQVDRGGLVVGGGVLDANGIFTSSGSVNEGVSASTDSGADALVINRGRIYGDFGAVALGLGGGNAIVDNAGLIAGDNNDGVWAMTSGGAGGAALVINRAGGVIESKGSIGVEAWKAGAATSNYVSNTVFGRLITDAHVINLGAIGASQPALEGGVSARTEGSGAAIVENAGSIRGDLGGIYATSNNGSYINNSGSVVGNLLGVQGLVWGIGVLDVRNSGSITSLMGEAVRLTNATGAGRTQLVNSGLLQGAGLTPSTAVVVIASGSPTSIVNSGVIRSNDNAPTALAMAAGLSGVVSISNSGLINGRVALTDRDDVFQNLDGGVWRMSGTSNFYGGADRLTNAGRIVSVGDPVVDMGAGANSVWNGGVIQVTNGAAPGQAVFTATGGTLAFANAGLIDLQNDGAHSVANTATINGSFNAMAGSALAVDAQLGPAGSMADRLTINGPATGGVTLVSVRNAVAGVGALNTAGITVARLNGANTGGGFALSPASPGYTLIHGAPVIDAGFYYYTLEQGGGAGCNGAAVCYSLYSGPSTKAFILPVSVTTTQALWQDTALMWEERQTELRDARPIESGFMSLAAPRAAPAPAPTLASAGRFGVWLRPLGAWTTRASAATTAVGPRVLSLDLGYRQNSFGLVGGGNWAIGLLGGEVNAGVMGGYVESDVNFRSGQFFRYQGGTAGASVSYSRRGLFAEGLFKADLLTLQFGVPLGPYSSLWTTAETLGGLWSAGYRHDLGPVFIEPSATVTYSKSRIGQLSELAALGAGARFGDGEDFRGGFGGRIGMALPNVVAGHLLEASVTGRVWDQFNSNGGRVANIVAAGIEQSFGDYTLGRVYGEAKGNLAMLAAGSGLGAYLGGGARFNDQFTTWTARGGLAYRW
ncbi:MAG: hypothetical protein ACR652_20365 [Methylocystis sp.]|uniref:hypothetical protein n=1 Tax=Methylocystis sp. TaxID=1911079 RepID=UPI003DA5F718